MISKIRNIVKTQLINKNNSSSLILNYKIIITKFNNINASLKQLINEYNRIDNELIIEEKRFYKNKARIMKKTYLFAAYKNNILRM